MLSEPIDRHLLKMSLETGEGFFNWCNSRKINPCYHALVASYAHRLARMYEISACINSSTEHAQLASKWFQYAASIWEIHGDKNRDFVKDLRARAEAVTVEGLQSSGSQCLSSVECQVWSNKSGRMQGE